jgi:hypothetical protein
VSQLLTRGVIRVRKNTAFGAIPVGTLTSDAIDTEYPECAHSPRQVSAVFGT